MRMNIGLVGLLSLMSLWGCSKAVPVAPAGPQATVTLKDGSKFTGTVTGTTPEAMTLLSQAGDSRTYPMAQLLAVKYLDPEPAVAPATATQPVTSQQGSYQNTTQPVVAAQQRPVRPTRPVEAFNTLSAGTSIQVRNNEAISSQTAEPGQTFSAVVEQDVLDAAGDVAIPKGSDATLVVREANDQGKLQGRSALAIDLGAVTVLGRQYRMDTTDLVEQGREGVGTNKRTGVFMGGGAALGGIIGALAGGGKGAAIGALSGAGAGTAAQGMTRGKAVRIPSETLMTFRLEAPVRIREIR